MFHSFKQNPVIFSETRFLVSIVLLCAAIMAVLSTPEPAFSECGGLYDLDCQQKMTPLIATEEPHVTMQNEPRQQGYLIAQVRKRFTSPPASREYWYPFCNKTGTNSNNRDGGRIVLAINNPNSNNYIKLAGPYNTERDARSWVENNCPSWRCDWNAKCIRVSPVGGAGSPCPPGTYPDVGLFGQGSGKCISK